MMACGCRANGYMTAHLGVKYDPPLPCCVVHGVIQQIEEPDLTGRIARCSCGKTTPSDSTEQWTSLPFFEHRPDQEFDSYYCGCRGWD